MVPSGAKAAVAVVALVNEKAQFVVRVSWAQSWPAPIAPSAAARMSDRFMPENVGFNLMCRGGHPSAALAAHYCQLTMLSLFWPALARELMSALPSGPSDQIMAEPLSSKRPL